MSKYIKYNTYSCKDFSLFLRVTTRQIIDWAYSFTERSPFETLAVIASAIQGISLQVWLQIVHFILPQVPPLPPLFPVLSFVGLCIYYGKCVSNLIMFSQGTSGLALTHLCKQAASYVKS
jgi:hypothetical protein